MKATIKTVKNYLNLTIFIGKNKYKFYSEGALIESLVKGYKKQVIGLAQGRLKWFDKITRGDGKNIRPYDIYCQAFYFLRQEKKKYIKPHRKIKKATYGRERGYLFNMKDRDVVDEIEPKGKSLVERGFYFYEENWCRKTEKNWKSFRKNQYK